jgi:hypothetical protein
VVKCGRYVSADSEDSLSAVYRLCDFYGYLLDMIFFCLFNDIVQFKAWISEASKARKDYKSGAISGAALIRILSEHSEWKKQKSEVIT